LATGSHQITASYAGDSNNAAANATALTQVINPVTPTLSLASSANPAILGTSVTFTATLTGGSSPTGDVEFFDGATSLGTAPLTGGAATLATAALATGSHQITASYAGDSNNTTATATALTQVIVDVTPPSVQLSAISGPVGGVYTATATFSEPVTGLVAANLTLTNATATIAGGDEVFTLTLTPLADGPFSVAVPAGATQDLAGNDNTASTLVSGLHDSTPPSIVSSQLTGPVGGVYTLRLTFSEPVNGLSASEIVATNATVTVSGAGTDYVVEITPVQDGPVSVMLPADRVQDAAGNGNAAASLASLTHITVYPSVTLSTATTGITSQAPITVSAAFSETVTGLTLGEITVSGGSATALSGLGQSYDITVIPSGVGDVTVQIPAGVAQSTLGAANLASNLLRVQGQIVALTEERVTTFMLHRADALLASQPDLIARLRGGAPGGLDVASRGIDGSFAFRNSWQSGIWADIHGRWNTDGGLQSDYLFGVIGAEFVSGPRLIFGAMLQFDRMTTTDATGFVRGQGWLVGPYVAGQIGDNPLFYEARLLYGQSRNRLSIDNGLTISSFETERWLGSVRLAGEMTRGALTFTPSLAISQTSDSHDGFIDGYGNAIAAQRVSLLQGELGLDVRRVYARERGVLTVNGGGSLVFSDGGLENLTSTAPLADTRGRAWLGFGYDSGRGLNWTGEVRLDGLGTGSITPQIGLTWRLEF
ncbi:Ig-like domain-containing protein, partial [Pararhodobacter sp.]|uniref:Ig-like domain-containing protein n=1 Tax=Pararhodobacter sp. TaxID=2127056 RepID=UPI002AFFFD0E